MIGRRAGKALEARADRPRLAAGSRRAEELFTRYGPARAIVLARFIPVVRTVLIPLAGALGSPHSHRDVHPVAMYRRTRTVGLVLAGYALGTVIPSVDAYLLPVIAVIVVISLMPLAMEILRERRRGGRSLR